MIVEAIKSMMSFKMSLFLQSMRMGYWSLLCYCAGLTCDFTAIGICFRDRMDPYSVCVCLEL